MTLEIPSESNFRMQKYGPGWYDKDDTELDKCDLCVILQGLGAERFRITFKEFVVEDILIKFYQATWP